MKGGARTRSIARIIAFTTTAAGVVGLAAAALGQTPPDKSLQVARYTADNKLRKPADLDRWVFLGTSLGMGYNPGSFNAARPGQFQVVLMEPNAYRYFVENRSYAPGSMLLLSFYDADKQQRSINQNGFTQADLTNYEIHVIDPARGRDGRAFYVFDADATEGSPLPPGNACVRCHSDHGVLDGTFAQFYPALRPFIDKQALERAARDHDIR
ncbi:MAG TPA: cytochrome P460 family protein [Steroidobacteraceae bacterium]|nr:cytochrome P460 family protein [Steroidobacteraceae bacterium]